MVRVPDSRARYELSGHSFSIAASRADRYPAAARAWRSRTPCDFLSRVETFGAIIDAFGGSAAFAAAVGIPDSHARAMKARNSIAPSWWPRVVTEARARDLEWITFERLAVLTEKRLTVSRRDRESRARGQTRCARI